MKKYVWMLLLLPILGFSHPHIFVDAYFDIQVKNDRLESVGISWVMDDMTSMALIMDYDVDKDGKFDPQETANVKKDAFDHMKEEHYLTYIAIQGERIQTSHASNFWLSMEGNRVVYHFTLKPDTQSPKITELKVACYDPENFMAMVIDQERVKIRQQTHPIKADSKIVFEDHDYFVADMLVVKFKA